MSKNVFFFESIFLASSFKMSGSTLAKWSNLITNEERYHNIRFMEERRRYNQAVKTNPARTRLASQVNQFREKSRRLRVLMAQRESPFAGVSTELRNLSNDLIGFPPSPF